MKYKIIVWVLMLLTYACVANADLTTNLEHYWTMDDGDLTGVTMADKVSTNDLTMQNSPDTGVTGIINEAVNFTSGTDYASGGTGNIPTGADPTVSWSFWVYPDDLTTANHVVLSYGTGSDGILIRTGNADLYWNNYASEDTGTSLTVGVWSHIIITNDGTGQTWYKDGVGVGFTTLTGGTVTAGNFQVARRYDITTRRWEGRIEELAVWSRNLTAADAAALYNAGAGLQYPFPVVSDSVNITSSYPSANSVVESTIINFNATIQSNQTFNLTLYIDGKYNQSINSTAGALNTTFDFNITYGSSIEQTIIYNMILNNTVDQEETGNITFYLDNLAPRLFTELTGNYTENINISIQANDTFINSLMINDTCGFSYHNVSMDSTARISVGFNITNCPVGIQNVTITACDGAAGTDLHCTTQIQTYENLALLRLYAVRHSDNNSINFTLNWNNETTFTNIEDFILFNNLSLGSYSVVITADNYATAYDTVTLTEAVTEYNVTMYEHNSVTFEFRDENTLALIDSVTSYLELISDAFAQNYTTGNGTLYLSLLLPEFYTLRYSSLNYDERFYFLNLINRSTNTIALYLADNSTTTSVTATVIDETARKIEGVYVKVLRYDIASNSYILRETGRTNFEGETLLDIILNDEFYQFIIEYPFGTVRRITTPSYIHASTISFQITLGEELLTDYFNVLDIGGFVSFNNNTNQFSFIFNDPNSVITSACLKTYTLGIAGNTLTDTTCVSSTAGIILSGITPANDTTYEAKGFVYISNRERFIDSASVSYQKSVTTGRFGLFLTLIIFLVLVFMFSWSPSLALIISPLSFVVASFGNLTDLSPSITIPIWIVCLIIAYIISK